MKQKQTLMLRIVAMSLIYLLIGLPISYAAPTGISTNAESAALIDVASGRLLVSHNGDKQMRIASLTKIMTAIVAIEHGSLSDQVQVSSKAAGKEGSSIYLRAGEQMSLENMLYGLMLRSGNDAATAIAEHVGGSQDGFVHLMNEKAAMIGMVRSQFKNPSGLDDEGHFSTANDMAKLTAYALRNPVFRSIVKTKSKKAPNPNESWDYNWSNKNKMLSLYEGADGVKTGYTKLAKRCLVSSATRNGQQLAAVTLNDGDDWHDHRKLLDYGFSTYPLQYLAQKGDIVEKLPIAVGQTFPYPLHEDELQLIRKEVVLLDPQTTAYKLGERGALFFSLGQTQIGSVPLYDVNSPRLAEKERSIFSYMESESYEATPYFLWELKFRAIVRRLFVLSD